MGGAFTTEELINLEAVRSNPLILWKSFTTLSQLMNGEWYHFVEMSNDIHIKISLMHISEIYEHTVKPRFWFTFTPSKFRKSRNQRTNRNIECAIYFNQKRHSHIMYTLNISCSIFMWNQNVVIFSITLNIEYTNSITMGIKPHWANTDAHIHISDSSLHL